MNVTCEDSSTTRKGEMRTWRTSGEFTENKTLVQLISTLLRTQLRNKEYATDCVELSWQFPKVTKSCHNFEHQVVVNTSQWKMNKVEKQ